MRKQVQISVKSLRKGCLMSMEGRIWERESFEVGKKNDGVTDDKTCDDDNDGRRR